MSYKNTMRLFVSNLALAWKQLVYLLCCVFLFALCSYTLVSPIVSILRNAGIGTELKNLLTVVYNNPKDIALNLSEIFSIIFNSIVENFSKIYLNLLGTLVLCIIVPYILFEISIYNITSILYQKSTMNMEVGYCQNYLKTFWKGFKFACTNLILSLPYTIINIVLIYAYLLFSKTVLRAIIGMVLLSALTIIVNSTKITLFSHYTGNIVSNEINPFNAFSHSLKLEMKNFWKIEGSSVVVLLTAILINGVIALFTFFAGLIFTIPATCVLISIYKIVVYFNLNGNRYYLSNSVIFNPQKYVVKKDDFVSTFIPPEETKEITTTKMKKKFKTNKKTKSNSKKRVKG